ncbi:MAG: transcription elongation factor Spt5 [Zestosphaera sp.]
MSDSGEGGAEGGKHLKYVILRTTAGQELNVALMLESLVRNSGTKGVYSVIIPPKVKGYIIIETEGHHIVHKVAKDIKHVKGQAMGSLTEDEVEKLIKVVSPLEELRPGDVVEVISGPFKGLKAQVVGVNLNRRTVTLNILEASFKMEVTLPADDVKPAKK